MTKAVFLDRPGGPEQFERRDYDPGRPGRGEILVRNKAIGLNFIDIYQRRGLYPVSLPAILGQEGVGVIEAVGEGVDDLKIGDRVAYLSGAGAYADRIRITAPVAARIPDAVSDEDAAALFLKGLTAEMLLRQVFSLSSEHSCLVYAAAGGVGTLLTQWASHIGARVIGVVGSEKKAAIARENGADDVIIRTAPDSISTVVREMTGGAGVDVVYDSVGADTFEASLNSLAMRGHMVSFGNASGPPPAIQPLDLSRRGSLTLTRPSLFHFATAERLPAMATTLFAMVDSGAIAAKITHRCPLSEIADAHRLLESGKSAGAIVLTP